MDYFDKPQYIAKVDKNDKVLGKAERWKAHKAGFLHRGFTLAIFYKNQVVLQHRKHPVFDGVLDITISSHQIYEGDALQDDLTAVFQTLNREWNIIPSDLEEKPKLAGTVYYSANDPKTDFKEHEMCRIYTCGVKKLKLPNFEFAYGFLVKPIEEIRDPKNPLYTLLAPWVVKALNEETI